MYHLDYYGCFLKVLQFILQLVQQCSFSDSQPFTLSALFFPPEIKEMFLWFAVLSTLPLPPLFLPSSGSPCWRHHPAASGTNLSRVHAHTATTTSRMSSRSLYPALDMTSHFSSSLPLTFGALSWCLGACLILRPDLDSKSN